MDSGSTNSATADRGGAVFASLKGEVEHKDRPKAVRVPCIPKEIWRLTDRRPALLQTERANTREVYKARQDFQRALQEDRRRRVQAAG